MIELIKKYLKAGVMENGLLVKTTEGSPQGGPLSPLLANIYLNEYDKEMASRGVPVIRYQNLYTSQDRFYWASIVPRFCTDSGFCLFLRPCFFYSS